MRSIKEMDKRLDEREQEIERLQQENKQLKESLDFLWNKFKKVNTANRKAKEYINHENFKRNILLGFSGKKYVRDILNNVLEILGDKEYES